MQSFRIRLGKLTKLLHSLGLTLFQTRNTCRWWLGRELKSRQITVIKNWRILSGIRNFIAEIALDTIVMHRSSI